MIPAVEAPICVPIDLVHGDRWETSNIVLRTNSCLDVLKTSTISTIVPDHSIGHELEVKGKSLLDVMRQECSNTPLGDALPRESPVRQQGTFRGISVDRSSAVSRTKVEECITLSLFVPLVTAD